MKSKFSTTFVCRCFDQGSISLPSALQNAKYIQVL